MVKFTGGTIITVDQLVTAIGPDSRQIATDEKQAGPLAILGGPGGVKKILRPIYDLGKCYDDEIFATVLGLESEDGLLEVIGAAAYRAAAFTNDTKEAIDIYNELKNEKNILEKRAILDADKKKLEKLDEMLGVFSRVQNKFNNTKKAHSVSILVAEQLGPLNSTIEAINRVNKTINDKEAKEKVLEQIKKDGVNMQIDSSISISKYIYINWNDFSVEENLNPELKQRLSEQAAKAVVAKRGKTTHPHGLTWDDAVLTIKEKIKECLLNLKK